MNFKNKTIVVIGATSQGGMGEAVAKDLAALGARVAVAGRGIEKAKALANIIGGDAFECDIAEEESVRALLEGCADGSEDGKIDAVINAAGVAYAGPISGVDADTLKQSTLHNLVGPMLTMKHAASVLRSGGVFLQFSSISATQPTPMSAPYSVFKSAVEQALKIAALEYAGTGIKFLGVAPGIVFTPMTEFITTDAVRKTLEEITPLGEMVSIAAVVEAVRFLASGGYFESGMTVPVTGGAIFARPLLPREMGMGE